MKRFLTLGLSALVTASLFGAQAHAVTKLAFVTNNASDFWTIAKAGVAKADAELENYEVDFLVPADGSAATQKRYLEDLVTKGVKGIAISPKDPSNQTDILNDTAKSALLVTQDSDAPESDRAFYIGTDNKAAGNMAGELLKAALPNGGKIAVFVGSMDAQNAKDRLAGIKEAIKDTKIEIVAVRTDETNQVRAKQNVQDMITSTPDIACLVGLWSYNGPAIAGAIKDADKVGKIKAVVFDEDPVTLDGVKDGTIYGTVVQQPYEFGYQSVKNMAKYLDGDKSFIPESKKIIVPTKAITKTNVEEFDANLKKLLGK